MKLGNIATGADFFDRTNEISDLWKYLENDHVVASGPRRLGKSSIVNKLREEAEEKGLLARHVDVQGIDTVQAFIDQLCNSFPDDSVRGYISSLSDRAKGWLPIIKKVELTGPGDIGAGVELRFTVDRLPWYSAALALQDRLTSAPVLIFVDEFSVFLQKLLERDQKEAEAFLGWLRAWRVTPNIACRFLFTGSIGLNSLLEKYGLTAQFNDCFEYSIGPFKPRVAREMLCTFAERKGWAIGDSTIDNICERIGWLSPFYLCLLLNGTIEVANERMDEDSSIQQVLNVKELTLADVGDAYERVIFIRSRFAHWKARLDRDLSGNDLKFATLILAELANSEKGYTKRQLNARLVKLESDIDQRNERLQKILLKLEEEGYVSPPDAAGKIIFLSFLLRDYWARNYV